MVPFGISPVRDAFHEDPFVGTCGSFPAPSKTLPGDPLTLSYGPLYSTIDRPISINKIHRYIHTLLATMQFAIDHVSIRITTSTKISHSFPIY